jgi:hypothetical protein
LEASSIGDREHAMRKAFREFKAGDNIARFHGGWWALMSPPEEPVGKPIFPEIPREDPTMGFSRRIEQMREAIFLKGDPASEVLERLFTVLPDDLLPNSTGLLARLQRQGQHYGADITQLPVPPPATLQPDDPDLPVLLDAEKLNVLGKSDAFPFLGPAGDDYWLCGEYELRCVATKAGQWVDMALPVPRSGKYAVQLHLSRGPESSSVKFSLNGRPVGSDVDLWAPDPGLLPTLELGRFDLPAGDAVLRVETVAKHAQAKGCQFGIDSVVLRPADR